MSLRVAIVGCGKVADDHAEAISFHPGASVVACCDNEPLMAEQLATRYSIPSHYDSLDEMLASEAVDVVHVTTPPQSHLSISMSALSAGAHVWVEKPLALNLAQVEELIAAAEQSSRLITVGHSYWLDTPAEDVRELVASRAIGDVVHVESWYGYDIAGTYGKAIMDTPENWVHSLPGKLFQNNLDHLLNKVLEFLPSDDITVHAHAFRRFDRRDGDLRDDLLDELRVMLLDPTGPTAYATFSSSVRPGNQTLRVCGTKGTVHADFALRTVELEGSLSVPTNLGRLFPSFERVSTAARTAVRNSRRFARSEFHYFAGFRTLLADFYEAVENNGAPPIAYSEMIRMTAIQDEIWEQIDQ